ncbi:hypothetical protein FS749_012650 [Ceratobasidium sp. UAMH 11750]|nr:hypothetical protein FS749_012650 [Ceratobasidium sp. UAMH 11750]
MFSMMKTSLSIVLDSLEDANNHGIASKDEMEPGEKEALIEVLQQLKSVSSHSMQLKRKLAETGHVKSKVRRKGTGPGEAEPKLQNESYTTSTLEYDLPFDFLQFVHQICGQGIPFPLDHALKCAVAGFTPVEDFVSRRG